MARDYKYRASTKKKRRSIPPWIWILFGCLLGILIMSVAWLNLEKSSDEIVEWIGAKPDREPQTIEIEQIQKKPLAHKPRFEFYEKLSRQEILVPDDQIELRKNTEIKKIFEIQVGSFLTLEDAENLKVKLAFLGIETNIKKTEISSENTRYRVISELLNGKINLDKAIKKLNKNGYSDLFVRLVP